jgi:hypothetical protein
MTVSRSSIFLPHLFGGGKDLSQYTHGFQKNLIKSTWLYVQIHTPLLAPWKMELFLEDNQEVFFLVAENYLYS